MNRIITLREIHHEAERLFPGSFLDVSMHPMKDDSGNSGMVIISVPRDTRLFTASFMLTPDDMHLTIERFGDRYIAPAVDRLRKAMAALQ